MSKEFSAPFVMKIRFYLPSGLNKSKNTAHAKYICDKAVQPSETEIHAQYIGERKGSRGLFGPDGVEDLQNIQDQLKSHKGVVWRYILSLREEDAKRMGHNTKEDWERVIRQSIPGVTDAMGVNLANAKWVAAYHDAKGHPHVHLMMWEKEPEIERGLFDSKERKNIRRAFMREFYGEERRTLMLEKTLYRDAIRESAILTLGLQVNPNRKENSLPVFSSIDRDLDKELKKRLRTLKEIIPKKGRLALKAMPTDVQHKAQEIAFWLIHQDKFNGLLAQYLERVRDITKHHTQKEEILKKAETNAINDLRDRVAQVLLRAAGKPDVLDKVLEKCNAENFAWALFSSLSTIEQHKGAEVFADQDNLLKILGEEGYEKWKNKERLTMER